MKRKLFRSTLLAAITVSIFCFSVTAAVVYHYFFDQHVNELKSRTQSMASAISAYGEEILNDLSPDDSVRITLIDTDGTVLMDSLFDPASLENHSDRQEVRDALENGLGQTSRYSSTFLKRSDNCAVRLDNGHILRLSDTQYTPVALVRSVLWLAAGVLLISVLLSVLLSVKVSKSITAPINRIDLEHPNKKEIYPELRPLAERIDTQNRQIERQMNELKLEHERQDRFRREFTANVSHELKTPLTSISGYAEIIQNGMVEPKDVAVFAGRIYSESRRLITLVEDIIKLSQLEEKDIALPTARIDLYDAAADVLDHLRASADGQNISMRLTGEHLMITGVRQLIDEMIYNLCDNSIKYNKPGGSVTVTVSREGEKVLLTVSDTGIGIPKESIDRVFERFYRMDKSHSKAVGGTGLGLSIVKHGAAYHNAEIICNSTVGVGTTISIVFPGK